MNHAMRTIGIFLLALCTGIVSSKAAASPLEGRWEGVIVVDSAELEVDFVVAVEAGENGALAGTINFPTQGPELTPLEELSTTPAGDVFFASRDANDVVAMFNGVLSPDGSEVAGDITEQGQVRPFSMRRATGAKKSVQLRDLSEGAELLEAFNRDRDRVRLLTVLSPSCGLCKMGVRLIDRYVLDAIEDPDLSVYVVWENISSQDSKEMAQAAANLLHGDRVTHFWAEDRWVGEALQEQVGLESPAWDVFLLFPQGATWQGSPPEARLMMHNLRGSDELPKEAYLNGLELAEGVRELLSQPAAATPAS